MLDNQYDLIVLLDDVTLILYIFTIEFMTSPWSQVLQQTKVHDCTTDLQLQAKQENLNKMLNELFTNISKHKTS